MAIINDITTVVLINGVPATEHPVSPSNSPSPSPSPSASASSEGNNVTTYVATTYIEATPDQPFAIQTTISRHYKWTSSEDRVGAYVYLDGKYAGGVGMGRPTSTTSNASGYPGYIYNPNHHASSKSKMVIDHRVGRDEGGTFTQAFKFAKLETRDMERRDDPKRLVEKYGALGEIRVEVWRDQHVGVGRLHGHDAREERKVRCVPEKALKGRALGVATSFGTKRREQVRAPMKVQHLDDAPIAKFVFKYCTRKDLQTMMVVPRSPSPVPIEERPVEELSREEMAELLRAQREQLQLAQRQVKQERGIKREWGEADEVFGGERKRVFKQSRPSDGKDVIHLDSDDDDDEVRPCTKKEKVVLRID